MSTSITPNRNYTHPEKDEDLQASNVFFKNNLFAIDLDIQNLFNDKANAIDVYTRLETDDNISDAITLYDQNLDIYGSYTTGDVRGTTELILNDVLLNPGVATKVTVNAKGLVVGIGTFVEADITDFGSYMLNSMLDDTATDVSHVLSASKILSLVDGVSSDLSSYVPLTDYTDNAVLAKLKNVDGDGSGLDAELLLGQIASYYLDYSNFTNTPTTLTGYGITDVVSINSNNVITSAASVDIDFSIAEVQTIIMDADITFTASNLVEAQRGTLVFAQDNTGSRIPTLPTEFKFEGGTAPVFTTDANAIDTINYVVSGTNVLCTFSADFA